SSTGGATTGSTTSLTGRSTSGSTGGSTAGSTGSSTGGTTSGTVVVPPVGTAGFETQFWQAVSMIAAMEPTIGVQAADQMLEDLIFAVFFEPQLSRRHRHHHVTNVGGSTGGTTGGTTGGGTTGGGTTGGTAGGG